MSAGLFSAPGERYIDHIERCREKLGLLMPNFITTIRRVFCLELQENELAKYFEEMIIFHDLGKLTKRWQENLAKGGRLPNHAPIGAALFYKIFSSIGASRDLTNAISFAIAIHHTDRGLLGDNIERPDVKAILDGIVDNHGRFLWHYLTENLGSDYFGEQARNLNVSDLKDMARGLRIWAKGCGLLEQHQRRMQTCLAHHILKLCDISASAERKEYQRPNNLNYYGGWLMADNIKNYVDNIMKRK